MQVTINTFTFTPVADKDAVIISDSRGNKLEVSEDALRQYVLLREKQSQAWKDELAKTQEFNG